MSCLMEALEDKRVRLQPECKKRLNDRIEMWSYAAKVMAESTCRGGHLCCQVPGLFKALPWLSGLGCEAGRK